MSKKFEAIYLPNDKNHQSKKGFNSEEEALAYIAQNICDSCKRDFPDKPLDSFCAAEWIVSSQKDE